MQPSLARLKHKSSSSATWLARQARDYFVNQRTKSLENYRSRAAFKLLELDKLYGFLQHQNVRNGTVVDLGAAPGGWSQVVAKTMGWNSGTLQGAENNSISKPPSSGRIIAIDLTRMQPIPGVQILQLDFLSPFAERTLERHFTPSGKADVILSDMAANLAGNRVRDVETSLDICTAVYIFAARHLRTADDIGHRRGGVIVYVPSSKLSAWGMF